MHGGKGEGAPKGNSNARKHGHYSGDAIARRRLFATVVREARKVIDQVD
jgi:hypothetical protein